MDWEEPDEWFQGVKAVVDMDPDAIDDRFDIGPDEGAAHLFSGDLFEDVRGGGFLYTKRDSLDRDRLPPRQSRRAGGRTPRTARCAVDPPAAGGLVQNEYHEREYAAKLVPDSKKVAHREPYRDRLVLVGDAAGQMQAQGPIIKG